MWLSMPWIPTSKPDCRPANTWCQLCSRLSLQSTFFVSTMSSRVTTCRRSGLCSTCHSTVVWIATEGASMVEVTGFPPTIGVSGKLKAELLAIWGLQHIGVWCSSCERGGQMSSCGWGGCAVTGKVVLFTALKTSIRPTLFLLWVCGAWWMITGVFQQRVGYGNSLWKHSRWNSNQSYRATLYWL
jgi:hypothetical protein